MSIEINLDANPVARRHKAYGWASMAIGQSRYFPNQPLKSQSAPASSARAFARRMGGDWQFVTRSKGSGIEIYRVFGTGLKAAGVPSIKHSDAKGAKLSAAYMFHKLQVNDTATFTGALAHRATCAARVYAWRMRQDHPGYRLKSKTDKKTGAVRVTRVS